MSSKQSSSGSVVINAELCKGCGLCIGACAKHVLKAHDKLNGKGYHYAYYVGRGCVACGCCFYACPEAEAIAVRRMDAGDHDCWSETRDGVAIAESEDEELHA